MRRLVVHLHDCGCHTAAAQLTVLFSKYVKRQTSALADIETSTLEVEQHKQTDVPGGKAMQSGVYVVLDVEGAVALGSVGSQLGHCQRRRCRRNGTVTDSSWRG